jgi:IclR family acetate operon transcriptional repressor
MAARNYIELVEKTIRVIEVLAQAGGRRSLKEIAAATGLVKSSAFRILFTLRQLGYVERGPDGSYQLSLKVISLAKGAAAKASLTTVARPHMERLRDQLGESVWLAERRGHRVYLVDVAESAHPLRLSLHLGDASPLHASAVGKAIAAHMCRTELEAALGGRELPRYTRRTITDQTSLVSHLAQVRRQGYAVNDEETIEGAILFGAPVFDAAGRPFAAISVGALAGRCTPATRELFAQSVRDCAAKVTSVFRELGFSSAVELPSSGLYQDLERGEGAAHHPDFAQQFRTASFSRGESIK